MSSAAAHIDTGFPGAVTPQRGPRDYIVQLDGFRFIAVAAVAFAHWTQDLPGMKEIDAFLASSGVNLFFVLSGFLIGEILITARRESHDAAFTLRQFYVRRFLRIFPLYYLTLVVCVLAHVPLARPNLRWFVSYTANFLAGNRAGHLGFMTHLWSLSVEEQFYLFFPFLVLFLPVRLHLRAFTLLIVTAVLFRAVPYVLLKDDSAAWWISYMYTPGCIDCFGIGAVLAYWRVHRDERLGRFLRARRSIALLAAAALALFFLDLLWAYNPVTVVLSRTVVAVVCCHAIGIASEGGVRGRIGRFLENPVVTYLGRITYGLYVVHHFMPFVFRSVDHPLVRLLYPIAAVLLASVSWYAFERPINGLKRFFAYARPAPARNQLA